MPQYEIVRNNGTLGVHSFTDGFVPSRRAAFVAVSISEERVLAMCLHLEKQGDAQEANILLERYLILIA